MSFVRSLIFLFFMAVFMSSAQAAPTCKAVANDIVIGTTRDILQQVVEENPSLKSLSESDLVKKAGKQFLTAERPDFQAHGYMMLLWFAGEEGRTLVKDIGPKLTTEEQRAHYYFVLGLHQIRADGATTAATGRDYIRQMRDSGKVSFVGDDMWTLLIETCTLP
ncbi:exported protein of unknown function [Candidatus Filomicrobium marinum]|uniref:Uncharacterized protein n=2 Tax=Hyphomicrobiaceae TaxID=45401 RepID=A0A0D6JHM6_9HYPH|nr:exported protein of unknown function [Candidatus Filomicrobium marinum]CPR20543.1 exported protein of unknown function [Candidatus Filomicrobium marinum]